MRVCIVDGFRDSAHSVEWVLSDYATSVFDDSRSALDYCSKNPFDVLIVDQQMPHMTGLELVKRLRAISEDFVALVLSEDDDSEQLIDAVDSNTIHRYIVKPVSPHLLRLHVDRAADWLLMVRTNVMLQEQLLLQNRLMMAESRHAKTGKQPIFDVLKGRHPSIRRVRELAQLYAATDEPVLISGATGTGKELLARVIHALSPRRHGPFVPLNCSAIQESILESELFGYHRGAFTGAIRDKKGIFEAAEGGTIFLDEIGGLPIALQPKLLRVLQFGTFIPVGGVDEARVDVRIVSATNVELGRQVERGLFREDLLYRINAFQIELPPLRERRQDIPAILRRIARARGLVLPDLTPNATEALTGHHFPGNIRELANIAERLDVVCRSRAIDRIDISLIRSVMELDSSFSFSANDSNVARRELHLTRNRLRIPFEGEAMDLNDSISKARREIIAAVLAQEKGNISRTAARLGLSRQGLKNSLRSYGLRPAE